MADIGDKGKFFRLAPYEHQRKALEFCINRPSFYALLMEQGTGKTAVDLNDAAFRWEIGEVDTVLVMAPNGVHSNWLLREIPVHLPEWVRWQAAAWYADANKKETAALEEALKPRDGALRFLTMNWEALTTKDGLEMASAFASSSKCGLKVTADESQRIKNPAAQRTKALMKAIRPKSRVRANLSGTPIINNPWDAYSQFSWLDRSILQTDSYYAFKSEYAELLPPTHGLMRHLHQRNPRFTPQIVARDPVTNTPKWRNLDRLDALLAPHSFRVLKKDCLDLPPKVYTQRWFRMTATQQKQYDQLKEQLRLQLSDGTLAPVERLAMITKLSQIVSGYFIVPGTDIVQRIMPLERNQKISVLEQELESCIEADEKIIVWARFHVELADIAAVCAANKWKAVEYHGEVNATKRSAAIDAFQTGDARVFIGQQAAGGTGITLTAASTVLYYSNTWSLEDRLQSEDRAHRIGLTHSVRYVDIMAENSIDGAQVNALRNKQDVASIITGDARRAAAALLNFDRPGFDQYAKINREADTILRQERGG